MILNKNNAVFPYYGGKCHISDWIISHFPLHTLFVDVFGGAGNIILNKKPCKVEVYNDLNSQIVSFFRVLRTDYDKFIDYISLIPYSREEYGVWVNKLNDENLSEFETASWFYSLARMSFGGMIGTGNFGTAKTRSKAISRKHSIKLLKWVSERLLGVNIENYPFEKMFEIYDTPKTLFYCDPPYYSKERTCKSIYKHEM